MVVAVAGSVVDFVIVVVVGVVAVVVVVVEVDVYYFDAPSWDVSTSRNICNPLHSSIPFSTVCTATNNIV